MRVWKLLVTKEKSSEAQQILEIGLYRKWFDPLHSPSHHLSEGGR